MRKGTKAVLVVVVSVAAVLATIYFLFPGVTLTLAQRAERRAAGLEERTVEVAGHRIAYYEGGEGEPLLLLHGFGADKSNWVRVAKHLTPHFRVIAPDLPGFGESTRDAGARYAIGDQVERVRAFTQALAIGAFHLGGNSMGGHVSGVYASRYPEDVKSLWLLAPGGVATAEKSELQRLREAGEETPFDIETAMDFERLLKFAFVEQPSIPRPILRYLAERSVEDREFNDKIARDIQANPMPLEEALRNLPTPTLVVWGDQDRLVHVSGASVIEGLMSNAEVVVMKDMGHIPMVERPEETARSFLKFQNVAADGSAGGRPSPRRGGVETSQRLSLARVRVPGTHE